MAVCAGVVDLGDAPHPGAPSLVDALDALDALDVPVWDAESSTAPYDRAPRCTVLDALAPPAVPEPPRAPKRHRVDPTTGAGASSAAAHAASASTSTSGSQVGGPVIRPSTVAKQRPKQYKRPTASKFCHVCGRKSHNVAVAVCSRIEDGLCRKVVCEFCFEKYGWDRAVLDEAKRARAQAKDGKEVSPLKGRKRVWECPHCLGKCVAKAQCNTYGKTNYKRHLKLRRRRSGEKGNDGE